MYYAVHLNKTRREKMANVRISRLLIALCFFLWRSEACSKFSKTKYWHTHYKYYTYNAASERCSQEFKRGKEACVKSALNQVTSVNSTVQFGGPYCRQFKRFADLMLTRWHCYRKCAGTPQVQGLYGLYQRLLYLVSRGRLN